MKGAEVKIKAGEAVANGPRGNNNIGSATLLTVLIVVAVLYFARVVLIPLALALLLAFLLAPLAIRLRHWGLGRVLPAVAVVSLAVLVLAFIGATMASQLTDLTHRLPEYQQNIHKKVGALRSSGGGWIHRATSAIASVTAELTPPPPVTATQRPGEEKPVPVEIRRSPFSPFQIMQKVLGSILSVIFAAAIIIVLVVFMLIQREDLRDRLIHLGGTQRVNVTTKMLDDAAQRVSRYLLAQLIINVGFGVLAGTGLYFLGVPNPLLWGIVAALLRYIPYLGVWVAAAMPAILAFAVEPEWVKAPIVVAIYLGIDLLVYNLAEPVLYGNSTGISALGILVAAVFWTWLWGPVGLFLATPLTVCVAVIGRHVPRLEFLSVLLSHEPALSPEVRFYQRMLAMDLEEATEIAEDFLKGKSLEELYDLVIIPALSLAEEDRHRGRLDSARQQFIFDNTRVFIDDVADRAKELVAGRTQGRPGGGAGENPRSSEKAEVSVACLPARDEADEIAALMLVQLLGQRGIGARAVSANALVSEGVQEVKKRKATIAVVCCVPPFGFTNARYLCRRLRSQFRNLKVIAAVLTEGEAEDLRKRQPPIAADESVSSLRQALAQVIALAPVMSKDGGQAVLSS